MEKRVYVDSLFFLIFSFFWKRTTSLAFTRPALGIQDSIIDYTLRRSVNVEPNDHSYCNDTMSVSRNCRGGETIILMIIIIVIIKKNNRGYING